MPPAPSVAPLRHPRKEWTDEDICRMQPPPDGVNRNLDGLLFNLRQLRISPPEQRAIILKSNFGAIGHPMWKGFSTIRESCGKIRQPGRFLLSSEQWLVYATDERASKITGSEKKFKTEEEALDNFITRLRALNVLKN